MEQAGPCIVPVKYNPDEAKPFMGTGSAGKAPASDLRPGIAAWSISPEAQLSCSHGGCGLLAPGSSTLPVP